MEVNTEENTVFIEVKREFIENEDIKEEPPDDYYCSEAIERVTVKIEPCDDDEQGCAPQDRYLPLPESLFAPAGSTQRPKRTKKKVKYESSDDDYSDEDIPKKKGKELIKKTYTTKAKRKENDYTEEVTRHIQVLNISEQERQREQREAWQARAHMRYTCELCALGYVTHEPYAAHMALHNPESGEHVCDICQIRAPTAHHVYRHRLRHYRRYRCSLCGATHKEKETAASHIMTQHAGRAFACDHCGKGFKRPAYLKKHIQQQHVKTEHHECHVCQRVFHDKTSLRCHVRSHDEQTKHPPVQSVVCDTCSRVFGGKAKLRRHMRVHGPRAHNCPCGASFKSVKGFRLHRENVHGTREFVERAPCPLCERVCANAVLLRQHIRRMHTEQSKKYECDHCHRRYFSKSEIRAHIAWTHTRVRTNAHVCHCGRVFRTRPLLKNHVDVHHNNIVPERSHVCHCGKGFTSKQVLSRHMKSHEDLTYPCPDCGVRFRSEAYVKVHHQLRHLNMTRAQIKALKKPRQLTYVTGMIPMKTVKQSAKVRKPRSKIKKHESDVQHNVTNTYIKPESQNSVETDSDFISSGIMPDRDVRNNAEANSDIQVPLFDFVELKREIVDYQDEQNVFDT